MTIPRFCASAAMLFMAIVGLAAMAGLLPAAARADDPLNHSFTVAGPYTHENLVVYLIHDRNTSHDPRKYLTLDEGMTAGLVVVREKGAREGRDQAEVNSLEIENRSNRWLFLQAGDIVKGGKQDRTIMTDLTLPPRSEPTAIDAFCVERGRWTARAGSQFGENSGIVSGAALKRAIQGEKNQARVWEEVAKADAKAVDAVRTVAAVSGAVAAPAETVTTLSSSGTYNAIVENPTLRDTRTAFVRALLPHVQKDKSAVGIAVAINGEIVSADVYASPALFRKLSRKLLDSYATEALLAGESKTAPDAPTKEAVLAFLLDAGQGRSTLETVGAMRQRTVEGSTTVLYEYVYRDAGPDGTVAAVKPVHRSYLKKQ